MIYLHSTDERQRKIADALGDLARAELQDDRNEPLPAAHLARKGQEHQMITFSNEDMHPDLANYTGAPSATRTRDLLLSQLVLTA